MGKMMIKRMGIAIQPNASLVIPSPFVKGLDKYAEVEPVIAKTVKIISTSKLLETSHRFFNLSKIF